MRNLIAILLVAALMFGCAGNGKQGYDNDPTNVHATPSPTLQGKTVEFNIVAKNWEYNPNTLTVKKGDHVKLTLSSIEGTHGFSLPAYNINERLVAGAPPIVVEFDADKAGEFDFRCNIMCGAGHMSQKGKLIVQE
ncbi:MAG TPA: cupredoxin domain-containing protein [Candidatus Bilamarchaeum sp.]|nr:cupredoxin domain-containing protein [Candidatus Bilamarchaeum sp.]